MYNRAWAETCAKELGVKVNDKLIDLMLEGLTKTEGQCPCVPKYARTDDTICPCKSMREENICKCGLFITKN